MAGLDYWERLVSLSLYSQERRRERYQIIFLWKVAQGLVQGYNATFIQSERRGRLMVLAPLCNQAPSAVRKARESSLRVRCARLLRVGVQKFLKSVDSTTFWGLGLQIYNKFKK